MLHADIVARLEAEIVAHTPDSAEAGILLERLLTNYAATVAPPYVPPAAPSFAARYAAWQAGVASLYTAYDRAVRALMTIAQSAAPKYTSGPLVGQVIDPEIRALDPATPLPVRPVGESVAGHARGIGNRLRQVLDPFTTKAEDFDAVIESADMVCHAYQCAREHPPSPGPVPVYGYGSDERAAQYAKTKRQAEVLISSYLAAVI
jgi:hypothetical protein